MKLKKDKCCCGGTKKTPCICMVQGNQCSASPPKCPCYRLMDKQKTALKKMDVFKSAWSILKENSGVKYD